MTWKAIATDGYPPVGQAVLVTNGHVSAVLRLQEMVRRTGPSWIGDAFGGYECELDFDYSAHPGMPWGPATHWMPMPPLPGATLA